MMCPMTYSQVAVCTIIILQVWSVTALTLKTLSTQKTACENEEVQLKWEYELNPNEYVDAKTWSCTKNEKTILIAQWTYYDGPTLDPNFINTITIIGNDSLIIRNITTKDGGTYTLTLFLRQSSQPNPKLSLNLTVLQPPLTGCCKPSIQRLENGTGLRANLNLQACGTGPFQLNWNNASQTMSDGDVLKFLALNLVGTFKVCVTGLSIETCFKGERESLCQNETIEDMKKIPQTTEQNIALIAGLSSGGTILLLVVIIGALIIGNWRRIQKYRWRNEKWKTAKENLKYEDDEALLRSVIQIQKATKEIINVMYDIFKHSREFALEEINTTHNKLENSEIIFIYDATESGDGSDLMKNRQTNPSYAQTFYHKDKLLKLIVVQGEQGIGNTTWCRKLVSTWCTAYENQYRGMPIITDHENIQTMKSFSLLFFVSLRNFEKGQTLANTILQRLEKQSVFLTRHSNFYLELLMENHPDNIIFIINDVDEADAKVDILNEILSQTKNSLTILTCSDWEPIQSKCKIHEEDYLPMAYITPGVFLKNTDI